MKNTCIRFDPNVYSRDTNNIPYGYRIFPSISNGMDTLRGLDNDIDATTEDLNALRCVQCDNAETKEEQESEISRKLIQLERMGVERGAVIKSIIVSGKIRDTQIAKLQAELSKSRKRKRPSDG